ncbi:MAG: MCE family protein [Phycisphaerales bacterium]|nr:MCE family protein [Phycisphaerales bacterium]
MNETRRNVLVGVFVLVGIGALGALIVLFGRMPVFFQTGTYALEVEFDGVTGVRAGNQVIFKGLEIGRVEGVSFAEPGAPVPELDSEGKLKKSTGPAQVLGERTAVVVRLSIDQKYRVPVGSTARTMTPMLGQGRPPIEIVPGPPGTGVLEPGVPIPRISGRVQGALDSLIPEAMVTTFETTARNIGDAAEALTPVLDELRLLLKQTSPELVDAPGGPQGNISSAVARLDAAVKHFNEVLGDPNVKSRLREIVDNAHQISVEGKAMVGDLKGAAEEARALIADAREFAQKADGTLENVDQRVTEVGRALVNTLDQADQLLTSLHGISATVARGEGSVGRFLMEDKFYESLLITTERLTMLLDEFRALVEEWRKGKIRVAL